MGFPDQEKLVMRQLKGVGDTVIARLEQIGFSRLSQLADEDPVFITRQISQMMGSTCWHNSPQARGAITAVITLAQQQTRSPTQQGA